MPVRHAPGKAPLYRRSGPRDDDGRSAGEIARDDLDAFMEALTDLSMKYGIGIAGDPYLFLLNEDDQDRKYLCDAKGMLFLV